jgi:predicted Fe-Mo cluster-binding NifX family protein
MKLAISISGNTLNFPFDARFGRAAAFCIVDTETGESQVLKNPALSSSGGAGVHAAQFVNEQGVQAVASGAFGPNAFDTLAAAEIEMYLVPGNGSRTAAEVLEMFKVGQLKKAEVATHEGHHGGPR